MFLSFLRSRTKNITLYNTLSRKKESLVPLHGKTVTIYTCGPTVYGRAHIGNLRSYIFADTLHRTLTLAKYHPKHVINITDVGHLTDDADQGDDKIEKAAKEKSMTPEEIATMYTNFFMEDISLLNIVTGRYHFPKASDHIPEQIEIIKALEEKGHTYKTSDGIYFDTTTFPTYGRLGNVHLADLKAGARVEVGEKKHPQDFALWKFSQGEKRLQEWDSPWGVGFPGWHLECSAMALRHLGEQIDIHTGGEDHIHIHHNNEIAQSESATGKRFASIWMHNAFLSIDGTKISKSLNNTITLPELTQKGFSPLSLRYLFLEAHYRKPQSFTFDALTSAERALGRLHLFGDSLRDARGGVVNHPYMRAFTHALFDDLNTPQALSVMWNLIRDEDVRARDKKETLERMDRVLGLDIFGARLTKKVPREIEHLAEEREKYRVQKNFEKADQIRARIEELGYTVKDTENGFTLEKK